MSSSTPPRVTPQVNLFGLFGWRQLSPQMTKAISRFSKFHLQLIKLSLARMLSGANAFRISDQQFQSALTREQNATMLHALRQAK
jgi:hypothetical protein